MAIEESADLDLDLGVDWSGFFDLKGIDGGAEEREELIFG